MSSGPPSRRAIPTGSPRASLEECVASLMNAAHKGIAEHLASHGLNPLEFALLRTFLSKEKWTTTQLAHALPAKAPRISRMVTKMADLGLMRRQRLRDDRRVVMLTLTPEGRELTLDLCRRLQCYEATLSRGVSEDEMAVFANVTSKVIANYSAQAQSKEG